MLFERNGIEIAGNGISLDFGMFEFLLFHRLDFQPAQPLHASCLGNRGAFEVFAERIDEPHPRFVAESCTEPESVLPMLESGRFVGSP